MIPPTPANWFGLNFYGAGCREKPKTLASDDAEKSQVPCDAFQDAVPMGAAGRGLRQVLAEITGLDFPKRPAA
jgi:hypothetical protein